jgi:cytochrome P450
MAATRERIRAAGKPAVRWGLGHLLPKTAMTVAARRGDLQGQLIAASRHGDPFPLFEQLRAHGPLYRGRLAYLTASLPTAREVLTSNDFRTGFDLSQARGVLGRAFRWAVDDELLGPLEPPSLLVTEPPDHTRYRKLVTKVFTVRAVEKIRARTEQIAAELLDELAPEGRVDLVERYCALLPVTVIAEILGVPLSERDRVLELGAAAAPSLDLGLSWGQFRHVESALAAFDRRLSGHLDRLRREPGDDLLSQLVAAPRKASASTSAS